MKTDELRDALDQLAGRAPSATPRARAEIAHRVRRSRRRILATTGAIAVVAVVAVLVGVNATTDDASPRPVVVGVGPRSCNQVPRPVARGAVPTAVSRWAHGARVVGHGSLWTVRRLLETYGAHDSGVVRLKISWFVLPAKRSIRAPVLTARELGGTGRVTGSVNQAFDQRGAWFASTIELPASGGCWAVTARYGRDQIRFHQVAS